MMDEHAALKHSLLDARSAASDLKNTCDKWKAKNAQLEAENTALKDNAMLEVRSNLVTRNLELEAEVAALREFRNPRALVEQMAEEDTYYEHKSQYVNHVIGELIMLYGKFRATEARK